MKRYFYTLPLLAATLTMSSCFKEEPLNSECDITHVSLHTDNPLATFYQLSDTAQNVLSTDSLISFEVRRDHEADLSLLTPTLQLTPGAKAVMTGSEVDNATGGKWYYQVVSEDGHWHRNYTVEVRPMTRMTNDTVKFDFEHYELEPKGHYYVWHILRNDGSNAGDWANGNPGFSLSMGSAKPDEYPTAPLADGYDGAAVKLTTRSTGPFGAMVNKRIAAGNLFIGTFDMAPEELTSYFPEIFRFSKDCRFSNCTHTHEPGCAVLQALEDHYIAQSRYQSYLSMMEDKDEEKYR